jgi:hypothetical protein
MATAPAAAPATPASPAPVKDLTPAPAVPAVASPAAPVTPTSALEPSAPAPAAPAAPAAPTQTWPEDWRDQLVGNDEKLLKRMQRYASPRVVANALIAAQNRISSGELRSALKANATPEEAAAWRAENGIPDAPEKYDLKMPNGIVFGEEDKPFVDSFLKSAHAANFHPDQVKAALTWYHQDRESQIEAMAAKDAQQRDATRDELVAEWGVNDFKRNSNQIMSLLDTAPTGVKEILMAARGPDEGALFNNPNVLRFFDNLARQINPVATVVPGVTGNIGTAIGDEIQKYEKMMGNKRSEYWTGVNAEKNQARYRELINARERMGAKAA